jgi:hypothetical protein
MPSPLRSPKTLSEWFELDYFRRRRLFRGLWKSLAVAALVIASVGVAWTFLPGNQTVYQAGKLSTAHALFNHDCGQCHTEAFPMTWKRLWTSDAAVRAVPDEACQKCHSGPIHHDGAEPRNCATCHREHRGQAALARVSDNHCTSCHGGDLKLRDRSDSRFAGHITSFSKDHPEFRLWNNGTPKDPGTIKFSHEAHLRGVLDIDREQLKLQRKKAEQNGATPCAVEMTLKEKKQTPLECNFCHQLDSAGRYLLSIRYESHCQECHPLSVQLVGDWKGPLLEGACAFAESPLPHPKKGQTPEMVRGALRDRLTRFIQRPENKDFLSGAAPVELERPLPGWLRAEPVSPPAFDWVNDQLKKTERLVFDGAGGCLYCHQEKTNAAKRPSGLPDYALPNVHDGKNPWYEHGVFRHDSHKMVLCTECHDVKGSKTASDVLLPRIDNCLRCHNAQPQATARTDCVECHGYHNAKIRRQFQGTLKIDEVFGK